MAYKTEGSSALTPNDPFRGAFDPEIRPSLKVLEGGKQDKPSKSALAKDASKDLSQAEKGAAENPLQKVDAGTKNILNAENGAGFKNSVQGLPLGGKKGKGKGSFKKIGPIGAIVALFIGAGSLIFGGQSLLPFSLLAQFIGNFDSISVSTSMRSRVFLNYQTNGEYKQATKPTIFSGHKFKIGARQEAKLKAQGIEKAEVKIDGKTKTVLIFNDDSGSRTLITPDKKGFDKFKDIHKVRIDGEEIPIGKHMTFETAYTQISDFFNGYNKASRTWKGSVGHWFDKQIIKLLDLTDLTRNRFTKFRERVAKAEAGNAGLEAAKKVTVDDMKTKGDDEVVVKARIGENEEADADGKPPVDEDNKFIDKTKVDETKTELGKTGEVDAEEAKGFLDDAAKKQKKSAGSIANLVANVGCGVLAFTGTVSAIVYANEKLQILKVISSFKESVDKVKAGQGADSPINVFATALVEPMSGVSFSLENEEASINEVRGATKYDENSLDGVKLIEQKTNPKTAMESEAIAAMYGNRPINQNDASLSSFGTSGNMANKVLNKLGAGVVTFVGCAVAKAFAGAIGVFEELANIASFGLLDAGKAVAAGVLIGGGIAVATRVLLPIVTKALTRDLISNLGGEDFGNALVSGAHIYQANNHRFGGGSLTDKNGLIAFNLEQQKVIADNARYERENRSPFDPSSQYTFLGTLLTQVATIHTNRTAVSGLVTTMGNLTRSSLTTLLPSANAVIANEMVQNTGNCPNLESIGAVGDAFCNPYIITDVQSTTIDLHPSDVIEEIKDEIDVDTNGKPIIKKNSDLARYVTYCGTRQSQFGTADQNIANDFSSTSINKTIDENLGDGVAGQAANTVTDSVLGAIPFVGDMLDIAQNTNQLLNSGWIIGATCVANNNYDKTLHETIDSIGAGIDLSGVSTPNWDKTQYYQRFTEDQRLMASMDPSYTSAVDTYLASYYEEHPIDHSYEGMLARHSGLTKETVVAVLDVVDYMNYVAQYDPSTRYSFVEQAPDTPPHIDNGNIVATAEPAIERPTIVYYDLRTRTTTV